MSWTLIWPWQGLSWELWGRDRQASVFYRKQIVLSYFANEARKKGERKWNRIETKFFNNTGSPFQHNKTPSIFSRTFTTTCCVWSSSHGGKIKKRKVQIVNYNMCNQYWPLPTMFVLFKQISFNCAWKN